MLQEQLSSLIRSVSPWQGLVKQSEKAHRQIKSTLSILAGSLVAGLVATQVLAFSNVTVINPEESARSIQSSNHPSNQPSNAEFSAVAQQPTTSNDNSLADGVYLYGQSPEFNQIGQAYMVFESRGGKMIGAFYMPQSEFDCFYGSRQGNELALNVVNSYDGMTHTFALGITPEYSVASASDRHRDVPLSLEGFHAIASLSELDRHLLATCKENHQQQIW